MGGELGQRKGGRGWQHEGWTGGFREGSVKVPHLLAASRKPFSIAGMKLEGMACPTMSFWNSNFIPASSSLSGSMYLTTTASELLQIHKFGDL